MRVDDQGIPLIVQSWRYKTDLSFEVMLFNGQLALFDLWEVRDTSCKGYLGWSVDTDSMALDFFVEKYHALLFRPNALDEPRRP